MKPEESVGALRERFLEPPFTILDGRSGDWRRRKDKWLALGIQSELGRDVVCQIGENDLDYMPDMKSGTSIFDPALCELMYKWFCPAGGKILDCFAGGSVRGIVANSMGYKYHGIELSEPQVIANREQAQQILPADNQPLWTQGDSNKILDSIADEFDMIFSCPPYANLEVYSNHPDDISAMVYPEFLLAYRSIINKAVSKLKPGHLAVFVVGDVRGEDGYYLDFISDTKKAFMDSGAGLYNEAVLLDPVGTAMIRANNNFSSKKLVKIHQNVLCFKKYGADKALTKKIVVDYINKCSCGGRVRRIESGERVCESCFTSF
jgi:DNA modification methylase